MKNFVYVLLIMLIALSGCNKDEGLTSIYDPYLKNGNKKDMVTVYHYDKDTESWHLITINENALPAHLAQGGYLATYVPDDNFEQALIDFGYDTPPLDDYVRTININSITSLEIINRNINDLTGIEDFSNLVILRCQINQLTSLDVSKNTSLTELMCYRNQLTSLNISSNTALTALGCNKNQLKTLDISNCKELISLRCIDNQLSTLDLSENALLETLYCTGNSSLSCIQVNTIPVTFTYEKDSWASFSLDCGY